MSDHRLAGHEFDGYTCAKCHDEITPADPIEVDCDGEPDSYGGWHNTTRACGTSCVHQTRQRNGISTNLSARSSQAP